MKSEKWQQIKEIFNAALEYSGEAQEKYLAEICGADQDLRREVEILLHSYESEFMEAPVLSKVAEQTIDSANIQIGQEINHYKILEKLGRGGMGEVYLAEDSKLYRKVAIKFLKLANDTSERYLKREARAAALLNHSNICTIFEIGENSGRSFIVMEYIEGETLDKLIRQKDLSVAKSVSIALAIADALAEAHSRGVVHRDIKPSNIIVTPKGQVKVLDFGLAKKTIFTADESEHSLFSNIGVVAGTVSYMSPEQARGQEIDNRSDIWSLGIVFYEILTGQLPFSGDSKSDIIASILTKEPPKLIEIHANFPTEFDEIISKSLQKNSDERYTSINELSDALSKLSLVYPDFNQINAVDGNEAFPQKTAQANLVSNDSAQHLTFSKLTKITNEANRVAVKSKFGWGWLVPAFLAVSVLFGGIYWRFYVNSAPKFETFTADSRGRLQISTLFSAKRKPNGAITDVSFSPDGKLLVFLLSGEGTSDIYVKQVGQGEQIKITDSKWINQTPVWSPDSQSIAFVSNRDNKNGIWTISYLGGTPILQTTIELNPIFYQLRKWSNDSKRLFYESNKKLKTIELDSGKIVDIPLPEAQIAGSFSLSNDEKFVAFVVIENNKEKIWYQSMETGVAKSVLSNESSNWSPIFFPDNKRIAYSSNRNGNFQLFVTALDNSENTQITFGDSNANFPSVSNDGKKMVYVSLSDEANIFSLDLKNNRETQITENTKMQLFPDISPDNQKMVFQRTDSGANIYASPLKIKVLNSNSEPTEVNKFGGWAKWSPTGDEIAFLNFVGLNVNISKINYATQKEIQLTSDGIITTGSTISPFNLLSPPFDWSPDGKQISFTLQKPESFNIWVINNDGSNAHPITNNSDKKLKYYSPLWSPDGHKIVFTYRVQLESNKFKYGVSVLSDNQVKDIFQSDSNLRVLGWLKNNSEILIASESQDSLDLIKLGQSPKLITETLVTLKNAYLSGLTLVPISQKVAFSARRNGIDNVFLYTLGGKETQLTTNLENSLFFSGLAWSKDENNLFFSKQSGGMQISMIFDPS